jgi:hypothetical protein
MLFLLCRTFRCEALVTWLPEVVCCVAFLRLRWHDDSSTQAVPGDGMSVGSTITVTASGVFKTGKKESPRASNRCVHVCVLVCACACVHASTSGGGGEGYVCVKRSRRSTTAPPPPPPFAALDVGGTPVATSFACTPCCWSPTLPLHHCSGAPTAPWPRHCWHPMRGSDPGSLGRLHRCVSMRVCVYHKQIECVCALPGFQE